MMHDEGCCGRRSAHGRRASELEGDDTHVLIDVEVKEGRGSDEPITPTGQVSAHRSRELLERDFEVCRIPEPPVREVDHQLKDQPIVDGALRGDSDCRRRRRDAEQSLPPLPTLPRHLLRRSEIRRVERTDDLRKQFEHFFVFPFPVLPNRKKKISY